MTIKRDKRILGQRNTLQEKGIDFSQFRQDRLHKIQKEMAARDVGAAPAHRHHQHPL